MEGRKRMKHKGRLAAAAGILLLVGITALLKLRYDAFVAQDYAETCYGAMYWTGIWYHAALLEAEEEGIPAERLDCEKVLREVVQVHYSVTLAEDLSTDELCRAGGHVQLQLDPQTHRLSITCDAAGHIWYNDEAVDETLLEGIDGTESGVDLSGCLR